MEKRTEVKKIIEYLEAKIESLKAKKQMYETPLLEVVLKASPSMQYDYTRISVELQTTEDHLLIIQNFSGEGKAAKPKKEKPADGEEAK